MPDRNLRGSKGRNESSNTQSKDANRQNDDMVSKKSNMREVLMRVNNQFYQQQKINSRIEQLGLQILPNGQID